ncbi:tetratricopeptide repeat protein 29 [Huso huso]|uniref:Tetratricopeptide repeat protein 29 n=1 Tax=Huso huso TaxID=61971 RepID=A0ABR1AAL6_HUSHU
MSTLPAMPQHVGFLPSITSQTSNPSPAQQQLPNSRSWIHKKDKDIGPSHGLGEKPKQPELSKLEIAVYKNSHKHNICVNMLREGYHKSFSELFALIQKWNTSREAAGPGSAIWQEEPLEKQPDKLDQLQHFLTRAEAAQRAGRYEEMYTNQLSLANYFNNSDDKWLSHHFFESCLHTSKLVKDGGQKEAEAHSNMGKVYMEQGQLEKAAEHYEVFHHLTLGLAWKDKAGRTHNSWGCESLWRIYTLLADKMLENKKHEQAIKTLIKAFEMAKEVGDKKIEGEAAYCVGLAYHRCGDPETATTYLNMFMEISTALGDSNGLGKAFEAMAKALESQGKITESVKYLEKFIQVAKSSDQSRSLQDACMCLGVIYNNRGQYDKGCKYFEMASTIAMNLGDLQLLEKAQVYIGIGKAHQMTTFSSHIEATGHVNMERVLAWKNSRNDMFNDPSAVCSKLYPSS